MSAPKHTPGPWQTIEVGDDIVRLAVADESGLSVLTVVVEGDAQFAAVYSEADARLIAAAPELLKSLRMARAKIAAELQVLAMCHTGPDGLIDDAEAALLIEAEQDMVNQIDAAIAKAEGAA